MAATRRDEHDDGGKERAMRILFATDGSSHAQVALDLIHSIDWHEGTVIRVVTALPFGAEAYGLAWMTASPDTVQDQRAEVRRYYEDLVDDAVRRLSRPGLTVERLLLHGRSSGAIVDEARTWGADLVVLGHRGRGSIETAVLGSVSAEVVDHAPCPVLVVRRPTMRSVVLATDGSPSAQHAEELLSSWPMFAPTPIRVVAVAPTTLPWAFGMGADVGPEAYDAFAMDAEEARGRQIPIVEAAAARLAASDRPATTEVLDGQPAAAIVAHLVARDDDLVVVGSRGHTGLARLLLGSVARNVLLHAPSSVLVVREHVRVGHTPELAALAVELS
jgi:nucleotide-binding universal stress UspA family protein